MLKKPHILDYNLSEWESYVKSIGEKPYRARQIYDWLHKQLASSVDDFSNIPDSLKTNIREDFYTEPGIIRKHIKSEEDGTEKILIELRDGKYVEAVWLRNGERMTVCVSTQAGCSLYCEFCMTARAPFKGNLSSGEILEQVYTFTRMTGTRVTNIVFMGMGEPLMNYENTMKAGTMINSDFGINIGMRRITISTSGVLPGIKRFIENNEPFNLALSIHSFDPVAREKLMDAEKKWPIEDVMNYIASRHLWLKKNRVTFEYVMIPDVNMSDKDALEIARQAKRIRAKINLIPLNFEFNDYRRPSQQEMDAFWQKIKKQNVEVFNRSSQGYDIQAACGMLRSEVV